MKKLLSILLAAATVFSTTAFASPAAEPIESADEISLEVGGGAISSKISDASLTEETASYYDPTLGVKIIDEDFENFTVGETYTNTSGKAHGNRNYVMEGKGTTGEVVENVDGVGNGRYVKITADGQTAYPVFRNTFDNGQSGATRVEEYIKVPAEFNASAKLYFEDADFASGIAARPVFRNTSGTFDDYSGVKFEAGKWNELTKTYSQTKENVTIREVMWLFGNSKLLSGSLYIDDIKLYYKPIATDNYNVIKSIYPTVTVYAPGGIEDNAVAALTAEPQKYFGSLVTSCDIDGETITLSVNGTGKITLPSVVNATKTKTLNALSVNVESVDELAPLYGIRLIDENFESFTVGEKYGTSLYVPHGTRTYATEGTGTTAEVVENIEDVGTGKYVQINVGTESGYPVFKTLLTNNGGEGSRIDEYITIPAKFTMSSRLYFVGDDFAKAIATRPAMLLNPYALPWLQTVTFASGSWQTLTKTYTSAENTTARGLYWVFENSSKTAGTVYIDDIKLYYKPTAADAYTSTSLDFPTITVTAENGFEENAVAAIEANPAEYLSSAVESVEFTDTQMIITLNEDEAVNYSYITIPELVNGTKTATYPETKIDLPDYYAPVYGLRNYLWNAGNKSTTGLLTYTNFSFNRDEGFDYVSVSSSEKWPGSLNYQRDLSLPYDTDHSYTYITKARYSGASSCILRRLDWNGDDVKYNTINIGPREDNVWNDLKFEDYTFEAGHEAVTVMPDVYIGNKNGGIVKADVAYIGLYYRPIETSSEYTTKISGNTVTVTYANGIDEDTAEALETYYGKYFGGNVTALTVNGNDVVMTLKDGVTEITVPKLVTADGKATYEEVTVNTAVAPTSLPEETSIRGTYPAGLRFKAAVKNEFMSDENLTEFGYIVARAEKLTESGIADLTIGIDQTKLKTIESPSYKVVDGVITINKYESGDNDTTTFAAVLVNIPNTNYDDEFAVRPYVVYGGDYYYGNTMKASISNIAQSLKDKGGLSQDVLDVVNKILNNEELDKYEG